MEVQNSCVTIYGDVIFILVLPELEVDPVVCGRCQIELHFRLGKLL